MKKEKLNIAITVIIFFVIIAFLIAVYFTFQPTNCQRYECFQQHMSSCSPATFVNEEPEASWGYQTLKRTKGDCSIQVTLLQAKEGDLKLRQFEGDDMICTYPLGVVAYPDKDLSVCHGQLKEDLQGLIIEKLHSYIINNLENISRGLSEVNTTG